MDQKEKYDLTQEEYEKCLKMAELAIFINAKKAEKPTSVFVVAQPGAGKTGLRSYIECEYRNCETTLPFIEFDPDVVAIHHKYYKEILEEFPNESYRRLQKFVSPALDKYLRYRAVQLRNNIIQEGTFAATPGYITILDFQKNGGELPYGTKNQKVEGNYFIDINVLAVHRYESLLSSYEREQYVFIENDLLPRVVTPDNHDRAYKNILETMKAVEEKDLYSRIRVYRRGKTENTPELVYEKGEEKYPNSVQALIGEREKNKQELLANPEKYLDRIRTLKERIMHNKINSENQLERINNLEQEFLRELELKKDAR